jgi:RimJ/RimL family protein N-acetyltransferase
MNVTLRKVQLSDSDDLLRWRNEDTTIPWMGQTRALTQQEHDDWFQSAIGDPKLLFLIIQVDGVSAGQIRYQQVMVDDGNRSAKVSINIAKEFHGKGVASLAFKEGSDLVRRSKFAVDVFANVLPNNLGSIKAMQNAGFRIVKKYEVNGRDHLMMTDRQGDI